MNTFKDNKLKRPQLEKITNWKGNKWKCQQLVIEMTTHWVDNKLNWLHIEMARNLYENQLK